MKAISLHDKLPSIKTTKRTENQPHLHYCAPALIQTLREGFSFLSTFFSFVDPSAESIFGWMSDGVWQKCHFNSQFLGKYEPSSSSSTLISVLLVHRSRKCTFHLLHPSVSQLSMLFFLHLRSDSPIGNSFPIFTSARFLLRFLLPSTVRDPKSERKRWARSCNNIDFARMTRVVAGS